MGKYQIRFYRHPLRKDKGDFSFIGETDSLLEAKRIRQLSGDLVTDIEGNVIRERLWLWNWEMNNPDSLAYRVTG